MSAISANLQSLAHLPQVREAIQVSPLITSCLKAFATAGIFAVYAYKLATPSVAPIAMFAGTVVLADELVKHGLFRLAQKRVISLKTGRILATISEVAKIALLTAAFAQLNLSSLPVVATLGAIWATYKIGTTIVYLTKPTTVSARVA